MNDIPKTKRRWFQFSLRTLLATMLAASIGLGWFANKFNAKRQRDAVEAIKTGFRPELRVNLLAVNFDFAQHDLMRTRLTAGLGHVFRVPPPHVTSFTSSRSLLVVTGLNSC